MTLPHAQDAIAGLIALAALGWLIRRRLRSRGPACEGCPAGGCEPVPRAAGREDAPLVTIEGLGGSHGPGPDPRHPGRARP